MSEEENLLALCRTCTNTLNSILEKDLPTGVSLQIKQKLFILKTAISEFENNKVSKHTPIENVTNLKDATKDFETKIINEAIKIHGSKRSAAKALGMDHSTLIKKCQRYGI